MAHILDRLVNPGDPIRYRPKAKPVPHLEVGEVYAVAETMLSNLHPGHPEGVWMVRVTRNGEEVFSPRLPGIPFWMRLEAFERA